MAKEGKMLRHLLSSCGMLAIALVTAGIAVAWVCVPAQAPDHVAWSYSGDLSVSAGSQNGDTSASVAFVSAEYHTTNEGQDVNGPEVCGTTATSGDHSIMLDWEPEDGSDSGTAVWHTTITHVLAPDGTGSSVCLNGGVFHGSYVIVTTGYLFKINGNDMGVVAAPPDFRGRGNIQTSNDPPGVKTTLDMTDSYSLNEPPLQHQWDVELPPWLDSEGLGHPSRLEATVTTAATGTYTGSNPQGVQPYIPSHTVGGGDGTGPAFLHAVVSLTIPEPH